MTLRCILLAIEEAIIDAQAEAFLTDPLQGSGDGLTSEIALAVLAAVNGRVHAVNGPGAPWKRCATHVLAMFYMWRIALKEPASVTSVPGEHMDAHLPIRRASSVLAPREFVPALFIVGVWSLQFISLTAQQALMGETTLVRNLAPRLLAGCVGVLISFGILHVHQRQEGKPLAIRALTGFALAVCGALIHAAANFGIFQIFMPKENIERATLGTYLSATTFWFWCYFAISCLLLALVYSRELRERERELANLERLAQAAQLKALRYQINPHFMFNTLNSIAALVCTRQNATAERMVESLGDFLRATLAIDPQEDHRLADELELQKLYLGIEKLRFPDRISVDFDVTPDALRALVPSLILQPLTENAVKHCVAVTSTETKLAISASTDGDRLAVRVINSPPEGVRRDRSTGLGLQNVAERLRARFGDDQRLQFGKLSDGSFEVELEIPLSFDEAA